MNQRSGLTAVELMVVIVIFGIGAAVTVPALLRGSRNEKLFRCQANLKALWDLDAAARASGRPPQGVGGAYWSSIAPDDARRCPFENRPYRGPAVNSPALPPGAPLGADAPGGHGRNEGGNLLMKSGEIRACREHDGYWKIAAEHLAP